MGGTGERVWVRFSRRHKYEQWSQAADRLGLTVTDFTRRREWRLSGFVNGLEVEVVATNGNGEGPVWTWYRAGITGDYRPPERSEEEVRAEKMRLYASPTVKRLWDAYPDATVVDDAIVGVEKHIANDADTMVRTVNDLVGYVKALRAES